MKYLIFVPDHGGHHLEYTNHLVALAELHEQNEYVFCVHECIKNNSEFLLNNRKLANANVVEIKKNELPSSKIHFINSINLCRKLKRIAIQYGCDSIFLIMLMPFSPIVFLPVWGKLKVSGIVYKIYLYNWRKCSFIHKVYDVCRFWLASKCKHIDKVFVLNDNAASKYLRKKYNSNKFVYLVDPFMPLNVDKKNTNLLTEYNNKKIISHIGVLKERKGTYEILKAINEKTSILFKDYVFVFAGTASDGLKLAKEIERAKKYANIVYYNKFLSFREIGDIVKKSYCLLLPYQNTDQSSGIVGYAAQYGVPVVVPKENLLKKIVIKYKLGYFLNGKSSNDIIDFFEEHISLKKTTGNSYCRINNVGNFINVIVKNI